MATIDLGVKCPACGSTMEWMPLDCKHPWHRHVKLPEDFNVLLSFDAGDWAASFIATLRDNPNIVVDEELMVTWFANALMRGYDEREWRTPEYKRSIRRALKHQATHQAGLGPHQRSPQLPGKHATKQSTPPFDLAYPDTWMKAHNIPEDAKVDKVALVMILAEFMNDLGAPNLIELGKLEGK